VHLPCHFHHKLAEALKPFAYINYLKKKNKRQKAKFFL
jgi:hypothetical protein